MGGVTSKFEETDWSQANGGLAQEEDLEIGDYEEGLTIDGAAPTRTFRIYEIIKKSVSQREFEVLDPKKRHILYITRAVPGTLAWFDVLGPNSSGDYQDLKLRVQTDLSRRTWMIYRYHTPVFDGQRPATLSVRKGLEDGVELYKTACVTVSWSRYAAVAVRYGPPSLEDVLEIEEAGGFGSSSSPYKASNNSNNNTPSNSASNANDSSTPTSSSLRDKYGSAKESFFRMSSRFTGDNATISTENDNDDDDDDDDDFDMMAQAAKIAEKRRHMSVDAPPSTPKTQRVKDALLKSCSPCGAKNDSPESSLRNPNSFDDDELLKNLDTRRSNLYSDYNKSFRLKKEKKDENDPATNTDDSAAATPSTPSSATKLRQMLHTKSKSFMGSRIFSRNGSTSEMDETKNLTKAERQALRRQKALEEAMEGIMDLGGNKDNSHQEDEHDQDVNNTTTRSPTDHGALLQCREIYNKLIGTHQTSWVTREEVIEMLTMEEGQQDTHSNTTSGKKPIDPASEQHPSSPTKSPTKSSTPRWQSLRLNRTTSNDGSDISASSTPMSNDERRRNSYFGFGLLQKASPATTPKNNAETTPKNDDSDKNDTSNTNSNDNDKNKKDDRDVSQFLKDLEEDEPQLMTLDDIMPGGLKALLDDELPSVSSPVPEERVQSPTASTTNGSSSNKKKSSGSSNNDQPLIGHWTWKNTYKIHKMRMHLAKNSDLAMHVVLAILVNQVRYERNAIAMTV